MWCLQAEQSWQFEGRALEVLAVSAVSAVSAVRLVQLLWMVWVVQVVLVGQADHAFQTIQLWVQFSEGDFLSNSLTRG